MGPVNKSTIVSNVGHQMTNAGERRQELEEVKELISDLKQKMGEALVRVEAFDQRILSLEKSSGNSTLDIQEDVGPEFLDLDIQEGFEALYSLPASLTSPDTGSDGAGGSDKSGNDSGGYGISRNERLKVRAELEGEEKYQTLPSHQRSKTRTVKRRGYLCTILQGACPYMLTKESKCFRNFAELKYSLHSSP